MRYNKDITELIEARHSTRTYANVDIEVWKKNEMMEAMAELETKAYRFEYVAYKPEDGTKIGTYGMIKGAQVYMVGIMAKSLAKDKASALSFGYAFEQLILKATELGLSTCWMVATFNTGDLLKLMKINADENIVMVSPLGYETKKSGGEKLARFLVKADKRKPWSQLFFSDKDGTTLSKKEAGAYELVLEMVRQGPSASNKQPWRIVKTNQYFDLYHSNTAYMETETQSISKTYNDMGIAKCHFQLTANQLNLEGKWVNRNQESTKGLKYVISWECL